MVHLSIFLKKITGSATTALTVPNDIHTQQRPDHRRRPQKSFVSSVPQHLLVSIGVSARIADLSTREHASRPAHYNQALDSKVVAGIRAHIPTKHTGNLKSMETALSRRGTFESRKIHDKSLAAVAVNRLNITYPELSFRRQIHKPFIIHIKTVLYNLNSIDVAWNIELETFQTMTSTKAECRSTIWQHSQNITTELA